MNCYNGYNDAKVIRELALLVRKIKKNNSTCQILKMFYELINRSLIKGR